MSRPPLSSFAPSRSCVVPASPPRARNKQLLTNCLTMRKLSTGNVVVPYKVDEAGHTRDAMTKTLYSLLFEWIIKQINKTLEVGRSLFRPFCVLPSVFFRAIGSTAVCPPPFPPQSSPQHELNC